MAPASWSALPNEIQMQILAPLCQLDCPITVISHPRTSKQLLSLLLVNKWTSSQARRLYQDNRFSLSHGSTSNINVLRMPGPNFSSRVLTHPKAPFCQDITNLTLWFFPEFICSMYVLQDCDSWAPLFRYQLYQRFARALDPQTAALEAKSARRIAWQASFSSLRRLTVHFDFHWTKDQIDRRYAVDNNRFRGACCDHGREAFVRMLGLVETAFPNIEEVDIEVWHIICSGHTGRWSSKTGLQKDGQGWYGRNCLDKCPQMIGEALQAAMLRGRV